jgi:hypothetical protein
LQASPCKLDEILQGNIFLVWYLKADPKGFVGVLPAFNHELLKGV